MPPRFTSPKYPHLSVSTPPRSNASQISSVSGQTRQDVETSTRVPTHCHKSARAGLNEIFTFASCVICNWLSYLISSHLRPMCAPSHLRSSHLRSSYHILYLRICITSAHLHISDLYIVTFIFRFSFFETTSCLHTVGSSSRSHTVLSYHLQDFIMQLLLLQFYNLIYLRLQDFISPLSGQPSSSGFRPPSRRFVFFHQRACDGFFLKIICGICLLCHFHHSHHLHHLNHLHLFFLSLSLWFFLVFLFLSLSLSLSSLFLLCFFSLCSIFLLSFFSLSSLFLLSLFYFSSLFLLSFFSLSSLFLLSFFSLSSLFLLSFFSLSLSLSLFYIFETSYLLISPPRSRANRPLV